MTIRDIAIAFGYEVDKTSEKKVNDSINNLKNTASKLLGAIGIGFSLANLKDIAEEFNGINDKIRNATEGMDEQQTIQQRILQAANDTKQSYATMADSVSKLTQNSDVFNGVEDAAYFSELVAKNFAAAGKGESEIASLMNTINTSMSRGTVNGRLMLQLFRDSPETVNMLARTFGVSTAQLEEMVSKGQVSAKMLKNAFVKNADGINAKFDNLDYSISDALLNIRNQWGLFVDETNSKLGITQTISKFMVKGFTTFINVLKKGRDWVENLSKKLGGMKNLLKLVATAAGGIFLALKGDKILGVIRSATSLLNPMGLKTLAIAGFWILLLLAIEDVWNFCRGNKSVLGEILENAGIDTEAVRDTIIGAWTTIKTFLTNTWGKIKEIAENVWGGLQAFWKEHGEIVKNGLITAWETTKIALGIAWNWLKDTAQSIFGFLSVFWDEHGESVMGTLTNAWQIISNYLIMLWDGIKTTAGVMFGMLKSFWNAWGNDIIYIFGLAWDLIVSGFQTFCNIFADIFNIFAALFKGDWEGVWNGIKKFFIDIFNFLVKYVTLPFKAIWKVFTGFGDKINTWFGGLWDTFKGGINGIVKLFEPLINIVSGIGGFLGNVGDAAGGFFGGIGDFFTDGKKDDKSRNGGHAEGGIFSKEHVAPFAEDNKPEAVLPLSKPKRARQILSQIINSDKAKEIFDIADGFAKMANSAYSQAQKTQTIQTSQSSVTNRVVTQNNYFENTFNGERAGQEKSSVAANKAAEDLTGMLARALQFS